MAKARPRTARDSLLPAASCERRGRRRGPRRRNPGAVARSGSGRAASSKQIRALHSPVLCAATLAKACLLSWLTPILLRHMQSSALQIAWEMGAGVPPYYGIVSLKSRLPAQSVS